MPHRRAPLATRRCAGQQRHLEGIAHYKHLEAVHSEASMKQAPLASQKPPGELQAV